MEKSSYEKKSKIVFYIYITQIIQSFLIVYSSILNVFNIILIVIFFLVYSFIIVYIFPTFSFE